MVLPIIYEYKSRQDFITSLDENPGLIIIKFGADWCEPCKIIENYVDNKFNSMPDTVQCAKINVDDSFDLYAFLKSKKIVKGIPTILCYYSGNTHYIPDDVVSGTNEAELNIFFQRCLNELD